MAASPRSAAEDPMTVREGGPSQSRRARANRSWSREYSPEKRRCEQSLVLNAGDQAQMQLLDR